MPHRAILDGDLLEAFLDLPQPLQARIVEQLLARSSAAQPTAAHHARGDGQRSTPAAALTPTATVPAGGSASAAGGLAPTVGPAPPTGPAPWLAAQYLSGVGAEELSGLVVQLVQQALEAAG